MTYRATPVSQRDGSQLATANCRMASGATGIDYDTRGELTTTGAELRSRQPDQVGGTDSGDLFVAWRSLGRVLTIRDGSTFEDALDDLRSGRLVHLDVWHASVGGPCLSGTGRYGHTLAVAPEMSADGTKALVADPWCLPARWVMWPIAKLRAGAEEWGARVSVHGASTSGPVDAARDLMRLYRPGAESHDTETGGSADGGPILFTTTSAGGSDVAIQAANGLNSGYRLDVPKGTPIYRDADLVELLIPETARATTYVYVGPSLGEVGASRAVIVPTGRPYADKVTRPTVLYVSAGVGVPYAVPAPLPPDVAAAMRARDQEWLDWLLAGAPAGQAPG